MFSRPPSTMTTPASQRMRGPKRRSNSSGMVMAPESRSGLMQKPVQPTTSIADGVEDARHGAGEALVVAVLGGVHAGDDAELGGRQRGDAQIDVHLAAGDEEVVDLGHVAADHDAGDHRHQEIDPDDGAVDRPGEVRRHSSGPSIGERGWQGPKRLEYSSHPRDGQASRAPERHPPSRPIRPDSGGVSLRLGQLDAEVIDGHREDAIDHRLFRACLGDLIRSLLRIGALCRRGFLGRARRPWASTTSR